MLEILLLMFLCKQLRQSLRAKGRLSAGWFQLLLVVCWFVGEFAGAAAMVAIDVARWGRGDFGALAYLGALLGAAGGATVAFVIAHSLTPANAGPISAFPVIQPGEPGPVAPPPAPGPPI